MSQPLFSDPKTITYLTPELHKYLVNITLRENDVLKRLREETSKHRLAQMQISAEEGQFLSLLVKMLNAKKTLEVGVFTGYSSLVVALELPEDGKLIACDISEEFTSVGKKYWKEAGVDHKIDLRLAPGVESLDKLLAEGQHDTFDFAFIDADKTNYDNYYERALKLVRKGGVIAIDNVLWQGSVILDSKQDDDTVAIRKLNEKICKDQRVHVSMIPLGDGVTLAFKL